VRLEREKGQRTTQVARTRETQKALARIERRLDRLREQEAALHGELAAHATDYERVGRLHDELRALEAEREALEEEWLTLAT
jgi:ABC transport system ATP-binding/permease protein